MIKHEFEALVDIIEWINTARWVKCEKCGTKTAIPAKLAKRDKKAIFKYLHENDQLYCCDFQREQHIKYKYTKNIKLVQFAFRVV